MKIIYNKVKRNENKDKVKIEDDILIRVYKLEL